MTLIVGNLGDSIGLLSGRLEVTLSAPLVDVTTTPDTIRLPIAATVTITNGVLNLSLPQTEQANLSYHFRFYTIATNSLYYFEDGQEYTGVVHTHTDSLLYTGSYHSANSVRLSTQTEERQTTVYELDAIVPNVATVEFAHLLPSAFTTDRLILGVRQVASLIAGDPSYQLLLRSILDPFKGAWAADVFYSPGEWVTHDGGSWYSQWPQPHSGNTPVVGSSFWVPKSLRGANGTGTSGNDAPYSSAGWNGQTDAPSRNAVRDIVETLARANDAALTGNSTAPTQPTGTNTNAIATCAFAIAEIIDRLNNVTLLGNPARSTTPLLTDSSTQIPSTGWVKSIYHRYSRIVDSKPSGTQGGGTIAGINTRTLNTIETNAGDVVSLSGNTFTLRPGTYRIFATAPALNAGGHRLILWNNTASIRTLNGTPSFTSPSGGNVATSAHVSGTFAIAANTDFQLRHFTSTAIATNGLGAALSEASINEVYSIVELWRLD